MIAPSLIKASGEMGEGHLAKQRGNGHRCNKLANKFGVLST